MNPKYILKIWTTAVPWYTGFGHKTGLTSSFLFFYPFVLHKDGTKDAACCGLHMEKGDWECRNGGRTVLEWFFLAEACVLIFIYFEMIDVFKVAHRFN